MDSEINITEKLSLKIPTLEDGVDIYEAIDKDREHLGEWLPWVEKTISVDDTKENIKKRIEQFAHKEAVSFIIYYEGKPIGSVGFISLDNTNKQGEIGYWLNSTFGGRGIMSDCVKACIEYGFKNILLHKILIKCDSKNLKSAAVPKRLGFTLEATLRDDRLKGDNYRDTLIFGLLEDE